MVRWMDQRFHSLVLLHQGGPLTWIELVIPIRLLAPSIQLLQALCANGREFLHSDAEPIGQLLSSHWVLQRLPEDVHLGREADSVVKQLGQYAGCVALKRLRVCFRILDAIGSPS